jgi:toxin-antitoxin system PIN domain toxin
MNIPDLNILLYAFNASAPLHRQAAEWWEDQLGTGSLVGIPWVVLLGFLRLLSGRQLVERPYRIDELFQIVEQWFSFPSVRLLTATPRTLEIIADICRRSHISGSLLTDACIAAQVLEHRGTLLTNDSDFSAFPEVPRRNPFDL